jgi:hypothetical protein
MIQSLFKNAKHCVVNTLDFKNFPVYPHIPDPIPIDLTCWKARLDTVSDRVLVFT